MTKLSQTDDLRKFDVAVAQAMRCELTNRSAKDPYLATDGRTYDKLPLVGWLQQMGPVSPKTGRVLSPLPFVSTNKSIVERYAQPNRFLSDLKSLPEGRSATQIAAVIRCAVSWDIYRDPVQLNAHVTLERESAISLWRTQLRGPDGQRIADSSLLIPNLAARHFISAYDPVLAPREGMLHLLKDRNTIGPALKGVLTLGNVRNIVTPEILVLAAGMSFAVAFFGSMLTQLDPVNAYLFNGLMVATVSVFAGALACVNALQGESDQLGDCYYLIAGFAAYLYIPGTLALVAHESANPWLKTMVGATANGLSVTALLLSPIIFEIQGQYFCKNHNKRVIETLEDILAT